MTSSPTRGLIIASPLIVSMLAGACSPGSKSKEEDDSINLSGDGDGGGGEVTTSGDGDKTTSGDGDKTTSGDGDETTSGDGDETTSGDGDETNSGNGGAQGEGGGTGLGGGGNVDPGPAPIEQVYAEKVIEVDELSGVSIALDGRIYASGTKLLDLGTESDPLVDKHVAVVRFESDGSLDETFGDAGVVLLNTIAAEIDPQVVEGRAAPGNEVSRSVVALSDGGVMVLIEANDGTGNGGGVVYLARLDEEGELVPSFGSGGFAQVPLTDWTAHTVGWSGSSNPADSAWDIQLSRVGDVDYIVLNGSAPAPVESGRSDNDRYVARLLVEDGQLDLNFGQSGKVSLDVGELGLSDGARRSVVLEDGGVVSSGYTNITGAGNHIVLLRLDARGAMLDGYGYQSSTDCGTAQVGVICANPVLSEGGFAEAYGVVVQRDGRMVTTGYGSPSATSSGATDLVSFRFDATSMDATYGTAGALIIDSGREERGRDAVGLAGGRIVHVGKYDALSAIYVTDSNGVLDPEFGDYGVRTYPQHDGNFFDVDARGGTVAAVGSTATTEGAFLVLLNTIE